MSMNEIIRQRRKELDYTQEQIAQSLGVSIPAVSKWESGATYPDVELLPALARVLKIDVNTLLCFKMELSDTEIGQIVTEVSTLVMSGEVKEAFLLAEQKMHEYPTDVKLIHTLALTLQGAMMMTKVDDKDKEEYDLKIRYMYVLVGNSSDPKYADQANYMLASRAIADKKFDNAQDLIDKLKDNSTIDKKLLQANLWMETNNEKEAEKIYASKILSAINQIQISLGRLIDIAVKDEDMENASQLVAAGQTINKAFGMWDYNALIFPFEKAIASNDVKETIKTLDAMLEAMRKPWDISKCPIYKHIGSDNHEMNIGLKMLPNILDDLENDEKYDFLRVNKDFDEMILKHKKIL